MRRCDEVSLPVAFVQECGAVRPAPVHLARARCSSHSSRTWRSRLGTSRSRRVRAARRPRRARGGALTLRNESSLVLSAAGERAACSGDSSARKATAVGDRSSTPSFAIVTVSWFRVSRSRILAAPKSSRRTLRRCRRPHGTKRATLCLTARDSQLSLLSPFSTRPPHTHLRSVSRPSSPRAAS